VQVAFIIAPIFGWRHRNDDGKLVRIVRRVYIEMPRKGAKTTLASAFAMLLAFADGEPGAEVYLGAASRDQARAAFDPLASVARQSHDLLDAGVRAYKSEIKQASTSSVVQVVSSRGDLAHGKNVHGALVDELHVHKNPDLLEALESGVGAREQPLVIIITTADDGQTTSVYAQRRDMVEKVAKGVLKVPALYGVVFAAEDDDDPFVEETWAKANPLYPVTPSREFMMDAADLAKASAMQKASFLRLHLGIRSKLDAGFFDLASWDRNLSIVDESKLHGRRAYGGLDLAATTDLTALAWLFPDDSGGFDVLWRFWMPEDAVERLDASTARMASEWVAKGWIKTTPGAVTDYSFIKAQILRDMDSFSVQGVGVDPWNATHLSTELIDEGVPIEHVRQGTMSLSAPLKEIDRLVRLGRPNKPMFRHGGNPVARWMADNLRPTVDSNGNVKPDKAKSTNKIDGISAATTAMFVAMNVEAEATSAYEDHGVESI
jgi:phage terminase large subunit-like protein